MADDSPFAIVPGMKPNAENFTPIGRNIVVRRDPPEKHGILIVPVKDADRRREATKATVLRVNDGFTDNKGRHHPCQLHPGDRVIIERFCGHDVLPGAAGAEPLVVLDERLVVTAIDEPTKEAA